MLFPERSHRLLLLIVTGDHNTTSPRHPPQIAFWHMVPALIVNVLNLSATIGELSSTTAPVPTNDTTCVDLSRNWL